MADKFSPLALERKMPLGLRLVLAGAGVLCIAAPTWELRAAWLHPGWWTLFLGAIILGAWAVGCGLIAAATFGEHQKWRFGRGVLYIDRRSLFRSAQERIEARDIQKLELKAIEWDSRAETFAVALSLRDGRQFETPDFAEMTEAQALLRRMRLMLGMAPTP